MKVSIIIPFYKNKSTITNLLRSIADQDYKNRETIIVIDGEDKESEDFIKAIDIDDFEFSVFVNPENQGAAITRNTGAKNATGDILFFVDADCRLYPGMLRECVTQLDDNLDIQFVYGNYRFYNPETSEKSNFYSQPFNLGQLETMNYICTMSPVRKSAFDAVSGFNPDLAYFQDWDLFYRIAKNVGPGKYLNSEEFIFETLYPDENSISGSKGMTLSEKAEKFRKLHDIKPKNLVVTTMGAPLQATQRAEMLGADYAGKFLESRKEFYPANLQFDNWTTTYCVGCYNATAEVLEQHFAVTKGRRIYHFIGSDVYHLMNNHSMNTIKEFRKAFAESGATLFANSERLVSELAECGIYAELLHTPIYNIDSYYYKKPVPEKFTVAVYYSDTNPVHMFGNDNSHMDLITDVIESTPDIQYKLFGGSRIGKDGNVEFVGKIPQNKMNDFINECSTYLRVTPHDGFPQLPVQFALAGRKSLVSCPDKNLFHVEQLSFEEWLKKDIGYEKAKNEIITKLYNLENINADMCNESTAEIAKTYYCDLMNEKSFKDRIMAEVVRDEN